MLLKKFKLTLTRNYDLLPGGYLVEVIDSFVHKFGGKHLQSSAGREVKKNLMNLKLWLFLLFSTCRSVFSHLLNVGKHFQKKIMLLYRVFFYHVYMIQFFPVPFEYGGLQSFRYGRFNLLT